MRHALETYGGPGADKTRNEISARVAENEYYKVMRYLGDMIADEPARNATLAETAAPVRSSSSAAFGG